jgi:Zn finger protein HypA/HybF involved in hydrogenase expression
MMKQGKRRRMLLAPANGYCFNCEARSHLTGLKGICAACGSTWTRFLTEPELRRLADQEASAANQFKQRGSNGG